MFLNNNQAQNKKKTQQEARRKQWMKAEMEDIFGDMMDEMGM
jgi:hypothetical protein